MLKQSFSHQIHPHPIKRQHGVVLLITLIILVAMTLGTIALVRSVDTTNIIAGNLSFQQAATHSADTGIEIATNWLLSNNGTTLRYNQTQYGYSFTVRDPPHGRTWEDIWKDGTLPIIKVTFNSDFIPQNPTTPGNGSTDAAGNSIEYVIQRMCGAGSEGINPASENAQCTKAYEPPNLLQAQATDSAVGKLITKTPSGNNWTRRLYYYRITARVSGPRNSVSYVQAIVAL